MPVVIIAGGAGFLGSHFSEYLLSKNFRVVIIDNLETGNRNFIAHLTSHPRFGYIEHNLNTGMPEKVESADAIIHLLGEELYIAGPEDINLNSLLTNSLATYHLLELAKKSQSKFLLASSLNIYRGVISSSSLNQYFGSSSQDERTFSHNEAKRYAESLAWEYFKKYSLDIRVARLPESYGPRMDFRSSSNLGRLLEDVVNGNNLSVYGDGLDKDYYIYVSDAVEGLYNSLIQPKTGGKIFNLCDSKPVTQLELAYLLKSLALPETQIIFRPVTKNIIAGGENKELNTGNLKDINFKQKIKVREGLKLTLDFIGFSPVRASKASVTDAKKGGKTTETALPKVPEGIFNKRVKTSNLNKGKLNLPRPGKRMLAYTIFGAFLFFAPFLFIPPISVAYNLTRSYFEFRSLEKQVNNLNLAEAIKENGKLSESLNKTRSSVSALVLPNVLKKPYFHLVSGALYVSKASSNILLGLTPTAAYLENLGPDAKKTTAKYPYVEAENSAALMDSSFDLLSLSEAELKDPSIQKLPNHLRNLSDKFLENIALIKTVAKSLKGAVQITPELLGFDAQKNYLVLLQNSNELRPTGGFIGSVVNLQTTGGRMQGPQVEDIYNLDGQIDSGAIGVPAPKVIKDNLNTPYLHIRDANFDPSFPRSADKIRTLYQAVTGKKIDGVIAIDLGFVKSILSVLGPIFLSTYNETITGDNLFEKVQFHAEANYSAGSSAKKTFLSLLAQKFFEQLLNLRKDQYLPISKSILASLEEKHLLMELYFPSAAFISNLGFRGEIRQFDGDYIMVVDSNVGANKANYFVKRSILYEAERANRDGEVSSALTISYNHTGTSNAWPGGTYKNYLRVLLPLKASLTKASLVGEDTTEEDVTRRVEIDEEEGKTTFAFLFELPTGSKASVVFRYVLSPGVFPLKATSYDLLVQKQPGTEADPFRAKFVLPLGTNVDDSLAQGFTRQGSSVIFEGNLRKDLELSIPLSEK